MCGFSQESFEAFGKVERVKKIKDYAFVHFEDRDHAVNAMKDLDGKDINGSAIEVGFPGGSERLEVLLTDFVVAGIAGEAPVRQEEKGGDSASPGKAHEPVSAEPNGDSWVSCPGARCGRGAGGGTFLSN